MIDLKRNSKKEPTRATGLRSRNSSIYSPNQKEDFKISRGKFSNFLTCKRWQDLKKVLKENNIIDKALLAVNLGMNNQFIDKASKNISDEIPYFSLVLIRM